MRILTSQLTEDPRIRIFHFNFGKVDNHYMLNVEVMNSDYPNYPTTINQARSLYETLLKINGIEKIKLITQHSILIQVSAAFEWEGHEDALEPQIQEVITNHFSGISESSIKHTFAPLPKSK